VGEIPNYDRSFQSCENLFTVVLLFVLHKVVLTFTSVNDHSNESFSATRSYGTFILLQKEDLNCDHSNEVYLVKLTLIMFITVQVTGVGALHTRVVREKDAILRETALN